MGNIRADGTLTGFHFAYLQSKQLEDAVFERGIFWQGVIPCELESGLRCRQELRRRILSLP